MDENDLPYTSAMYPAHDQYHIHRLLTNYDYEFQATYDAAVAYDAWLVDYAIPLLEDYERVIPVLEQGFFYGIGRDQYKLPNTVMSGKRLALALNDPNIDKEEVFDAFNFMMLYTSTQATV